MDGILPVAVCTISTLRRQLRSGFGLDLKSKQSANISSVCNQVTETTVDMTRYRMLHTEAG